MCDEAMRKIEEAFFQLETVEEVAGEDQLKFFTHSVSTNSTQTPAYLLQESKGGNDDDIKVDAYKQDDNSILLETTGSNDLDMSPDSQPCCERQQLTSKVEAMLRSAVKSLNAIVLKQHRVFPSRKKPNTKRGFRNIRHPSVDNEQLTEQWLGCKVAEKKKYDRLSLTSWRTFNRVLHQTQQSLKFFNIERRIYNIVH